MRFVLTFPGKPPSTNNLFFNNQKTGGRIKTKIYRAFEEMIYAECLKAGNMANLKLMRCCPYKLTVELLAPTWRNKTGTAKKLDVSNYIKAVEDAVCRIYGWSDEYATTVIALKAIGPLEMTRVTFEFSGEVLP